MSSRGLGTGWKGLLKAVGWSIGFGVEGLLLSAVVILGLTFAIEGSLQTGWLEQIGLEQILVQGVGLTLGFGVTTWHLGQRVLGLSWESLRWKPSAAPRRWVWKGLGLGIAAALGALVLGVAVGGARWSTGTGSWIEWLAAVGTTGGALALPALAEELMFRGVPLILLARLIGRERAVIATAAVFGIAHIANPDVSGLAIANITVAGVLLGAIFYAPGGIWAAWGGHLGWNVALAVSGAPVSGLPLPIPHLVYHPGGPDWLTGGAFGPEGGILATVAMAGAIAVAWRWIPQGEGTA